MKLHNSEDLPMTTEGLGAASLWVDCIFGYLVV